MRGLGIVASFDALLIGLALVLIGVPLVVPLMVLTFFGAFIPLVGAVVAGSVAALVALVTEGPVLTVTAGAVLAGVVGALLAVPAAAVAWTVIRYLRSGPRAEPTLERVH